MNIVGNQPQANTAPNIAAYQPYQENIIAQTVNRMNCNALKKKTDF